MLVSVTRKYSSPELTYCVAVHLAIRRQCACESKISTLFISALGNYTNFSLSVLFCFKLGARMGQTDRRGQDP